MRRFWRVFNKLYALKFSGHRKSIALVESFGLVFVAFAINNPYRCLKGNGNLT